MKPCIFCPSANSTTPSICTTFNTSPPPPSFPAREHFVSTARTVPVWRIEMNGAKCSFPVPTHSHEQVWKTSEQGCLERLVQGWLSVPGNETTLAVAPTWRRTAAPPLLSSSSSVHRGNRENKLKISHHPFDFYLKRLVSVLVLVCLLRAGSLHAGTSLREFSTLVSRVYKAGYIST